MATMGEIYLQLALYDEAGTLLNDALALQETQPGDHSEEKARTLQFLSQIDRERAIMTGSARAERHPTAGATWEYRCPPTGECADSKGWALQHRVTTRTTGGLHGGTGPGRGSALGRAGPATRFGSSRVGTIQMRQGANAAAEDNLQAALAGYEQINQANDKELTSVGNTSTTLPRCT